MGFDRRRLLQTAFAAHAASGLTATDAAGQSPPGPTAADPRALAVAGRARLAAIPGMTMRGTEQIAMLLYPGFTALDLVGPHYFFASLLGATVHLATNQATLDPVASDLNLAIQPTARLDDVPDAVDVIFVPGGTTGTLDAMEHAATMDFLRRHGRSARLVTSVCTGSLLLGHAGLLRGRRATSHWATRDVLPAFGATPVDQRVVVDGNVLTGAGVSAGIDLGLAVSAALRGQPYAATQMLMAEYAPEPPFPGGTLQSTDPAIGGALAGMMAPVRARAEAIARRG